MAWSPPGSPITKAAAIVDAEFGKLDLNVRNTTEMITLHIYVSNPMRSP
jgi:hypothetical protein